MAIFTGLRWDLFQASKRQERRNCGQEPGVKKPQVAQQNAYVERFNRTVRYEWLSQYHWDDLDHVQRAATEWVWSYNHERPNMALGGFTPKQRLTMAA